MNEKYVTDLEHSRKLVEAGWKRETEYRWVETGIGVALWETKYVRSPFVSFPAPLTDELLKELPNHTQIVKDGNVYYVFIWPGSNNAPRLTNLPNALADLCCWWKAQEGLK